MHARGCHMPLLATYMLWFVVHVRPILRLSNSHAVRYMRINYSMNVLDHIGHGVHMPEQDDFLQGNRQRTLTVPAVETDGLALQEQQQQRDRLVRQRGESIRSLVSPLQGWRFTSWSMSWTDPDSSGRQLESAEYILQAGTNTGTGTGSILLILLHCNDENEEHMVVCSITRIHCGQHTAQSPLQELCRDGGQRSLLHWLCRDHLRWPEVDSSKSFSA